MPGMPGRSRASSVDKRAPPQLLPSAWIAGLDQKVLYDLGPLSRGEQVCANRFNRMRPLRPLTLTCSDY